MQRRFYPINLLIISLFLIPSILLAILPPISAPIAPDESSWWVFVTFLEWIGRIGIFVFPLFWEIRFNRNRAAIFALMGLMLGIYYIGWIRFFFYGREFGLLFEPLFGIPVPLAVSPVVFFFLMGITQNSWPVVVAAVIMAISHIPASLRTFYSAGR